MEIREETRDSIGRIMMESEEACAIRMMNNYGPIRAMAVAEIQRTSHMGPIRGYYWRVKFYISELEARGLYETVSLGEAKEKTRGHSSSGETEGAKPSRRKTARK